MGRDTLISMIAAVLEEWDMKEPPNSYTGWPYEMIAEDVLEKVLDKHAKIVYNTTVKKKGLARKYG